MIARRAPWRCRPEPDGARLMRVSQPLLAPAPRSVEHPSAGEWGRVTRGGGCPGLAGSTFQPRNQPVFSTLHVEGPTDATGKHTGEVGPLAGPAATKRSLTGQIWHFLPRPGVEPGGYHGTAQGGYTPFVLERLLNVKKFALRTGGREEGTTKTSMRAAKRGLGVRDPPPGFLGDSHSKVDNFQSTQKKKVSF
jgi:hypothetical protein